MTAETMKKAASTATADIPTNQREIRVSSAYDNEDRDKITITKSSSMIDRYIESIRIMSKATSREYLTRLNSFNAFIKNEFHGKLSVNDLVVKIKQGELDPYDILSKFSGYLQSSYNITTLTL